MTNNFTMGNNSTIQQETLTIFSQAQTPGEQEKLTHASASMIKNENQGLDGEELFSRFTADIIKQEVVFTR